MAKIGGVNGIKYGINYCINYGIDWLAQYSLVDG